MNKCFDRSFEIKMKMATLFSESIEKIEGEGKMVVLEGKGERQGQGQEDDRK